MLIRERKLAINVSMESPDRSGTDDTRLLEIKFPLQHDIAVVDTWSHDIVRSLFLACPNVKQFHKDPQASHDSEVYPLLCTEV